MPSSGWTHSCWFPFGHHQLWKSKFLKTKFTTSPLQPCSSPWNTLILRNFRNSVEDCAKRTSRRRPATHNRSNRSTAFPPLVPVFPPVPNPLSRSDKYKLIYKPIAFSALVGTGSIIGCTIWQQSRDEPPAARRKWFWPICALNGLLCLAWRVPALTPFMITYFSCNPMARVVSWPLLLSTFSHVRFYHLFKNMFLLYLLMPAASQSMGKEQFFALYLTSGTIGSLVWHLREVFITRNKIPMIAVGASGAIMGILGFVGTRVPDSKIEILLPGIQFSITADMVLKFTLASDMLGLLLGLRGVGYAAHLAGCLVGMICGNWGKTHLES